ncbi:MAG: hypothetical protein HY807_09000 [Nitrospirae bacterium]|nr:hypothetical protein [Nitrospirota bacterium]
MKIFSAIIIVLILSSQSFSADIDQLTGNAAEVYKRAQNGRRFADSVKLNPEIIPTSDGRSFIVVWKASDKKVPAYWIVSLHGSHGFATDDLAIWCPNIKNRDVGLISLQWWIGTDDTGKSYYKPMQIYSEIDIALRKIGVKPDSVMLHGFSRGSANSYAVAALDAGRGKHYFSLIVASSGGVNLDYPPTRSIVEGAFGDHPLLNTRWITVAGARDLNPDRDGITGMRRTTAWLREQGATVIESIEDPNEGHGALMLNTKNARHVLDLFLGNKE